MTASTACGTAEAAGKALDGLIRGNSKWCSVTAPAVLTVDLGSAQNVSAFVVKHAGLGGETTGWNTGAYTIATSTDNVTYSQAVSVTGARNSRGYQPIPARGARYVRLTVNTPTNNGTQRGADLRAGGVRGIVRAARSGAAPDGHRGLVLRRQRGPGPGGQRQCAGRLAATSGARPARRSGCRSTSAPGSGSARC